MDIQNDDYNQKEMYFIPIEYHPNYKDKIRAKLNKLMMMNSKNQWKQLVQLLKQFKLLSTGRQLSQTANYQILQHPQMQKDMETPIIQLVSKMARTVLQMEGQFKQRKIQILQRYQNAEIDFTKDQILYIMCLLALNLVPDQPYAQNHKISQNYNTSTNFSYIFSHHVYKTKALINYFIQNLNNPFMDKKAQKFIIRRKCLQQSVSDLIKSKGSLKMIPYKLRRDDESIESFSGSGKVDFANEYIGGGALHGPCVQEEIMFANCPEMFVSMVFCQAMDDNESIVLEGFKKYSSNTGYGKSTAFDHSYEIDWEKFYKVNEYVVAIDAVCFPELDEQFKQKCIDREIIKSYCGFANLPEKVKDVITGNWGCGAFGGEITAKFIIQWISCSLAGKRMLYCPFGSSKKMKDSQKVLDALSQNKIKDVYEILLKAGIQMQSGESNIFKKIEKLIL